MANKVLRTRIAQKFATAQQWQDSQLVLLKGELAIDNQNRIKIGDGVSTWSQLPFAVDGKSTAISFPNSLPDPASGDYKPGNLVLTPDGILSCLVEETVEGVKTSKWVDLTNKADIESLQSAFAVLQSESVALQSAVAILQNAIGENDVETIKDDVETLKNDVDDNKRAIASNAEAIEQNTADIEQNAAAIEQNAADIAQHSNQISANADAIAEHEQTLQTIYDSQSGLINANVLPSFVDDVVEGIVSISDTPESDATYAVTHETSEGVTRVIGFFGVAGSAQGEAATKLKLISPKTSADLEGVNLSSGAYVNPNNSVTYTFATEEDTGKPLVDAPSSSIIYVDMRTNLTYRWSGSQFVAVASDLALGVTSSTAFYGDRGLALEKALDGDAATGDVGLKARTTTLETSLAALQNKELEDVAALQEADAATSVAISSLQGDVVRLEGVIENSIITLKQDIDAKDQAQDAAIANLIQQISEVSEAAEATSLGGVLEHTPEKTIQIQTGDDPEDVEQMTVLDVDNIVIYCGDATV